MNNSLRFLALIICVLFLSDRGAAQTAPLIANINARQTPPASDGIGTRSD